MSNKLYNKQTTPGSASGKGGTNEPAGESPEESSSLNEAGEAPNLSESRTGPNRSGGDPTTGPRGPFYVRKQGI